MMTIAGGWGNSYLVKIETGLGFPKPRFSAAPLPPKSLNDGAQVTYRYSPLILQREVTYVAHSATVHSLQRR